MLDLKKFNQLFGTTYVSIEEITNQNLFMAWVALTADSLGLAIIDQTRSLQSVREKEYKSELFWAKFPQPLNRWKRRRLSL